MKNKLLAFSRRVRNLLIRIVNARYSVSSWLWIIVSTMVAIILFLQIISGAPGTKEFLDALPLHGLLLTGGLIVTGFTKMFGMATGHHTPVAIGAFFAFCLWVFAAIGLMAVNTSGFTVLLLIAPIMIFNAYLFLGVAVRDRNQA